MGKRCSWGTCNADSRYPDRYTGINFFPFIKPTKLHNREKCLRWIKACCRPHSQLNVDNIQGWMYVCSQHFVDGEPTRQNPDPVQARKLSGNLRYIMRKRNRTAPQALPKMSRLSVATALLDLQTGQRLGVDGQSEVVYIVTVRRDTDSNQRETVVAPEQGLLPNEQPSEVAPQQGLLPIEEPSEVKRKSDEEAEATVSKICQTVFSSRKTAKNERVLQLVKGLTSLMLQIRTFSESDFNSFEFRSLQDSLKEIKETLDTNNINSFQNNVEIHISHIESWLSQMGNLHAFAASMQDT